MSDALFDADDLIILRHFLEVKIDRLAVVLQHLLARSGLAEVYFAVGCVVDLIEAGLDSCFIIHTFEVQLKGFMGCLADNCRRTIFVVVNFEDVLFFERQAVAEEQREGRI